MKTKKSYSMKSSKSQMVRDALVANPKATANDLSFRFNCSDALVYAVKAELRKQANKTPHVTKKAKADAIAKNTAMGAKLHKPAQVVAPKVITMVEASTTLMQLVGSVKDLCISFDHSRSKVDVLWQEEVYQADIDDLPKVIDSIKYLKSKELTYDDSSITNI